MGVKLSSLQHGQQHYNNMESMAPGATNAHKRGDGGPLPRVRAFGESPAVLLMPETPQEARESRTL